MSDPDPHHSKETQEILAAPEIFRKQYVRDVRGNFIALLIAVTVGYLVVVAIMRLEQWPSAGAWIIVLFLYPLLPYSLYYQTSIKMKRKGELILTELGLVWWEDGDRISMRWEAISRVHITSAGAALLYENPPRTFEGSDMASAALPFHPLLKELLVELADDKLILPGNIKVTHDDHPRFLLSPQEPNE